MRGITNTALGYLVDGLLLEDYDDCLTRAVDLVGGEGVASWEDDERSAVRVRVYTSVEAALAAGHKWEPRNSD